MNELILETDTFIYYTYYKYGPDVNLITYLAITLLYNC